MVSQLEVPPPPAVLPERPAILLLHGFFANANCWAPLARQLAPDARIITPDLLGYGTAGHASGYTVDHLVDHLLPLVKREQPTHLIGHSMGGIIALALAARLPGQFERVGIVGLPVFHSPEDGREHFYRRRTLYRAAFHLDALTHVACQVMQRTQPLWHPAARRMLAPQSFAVNASVFDHCRASHVEGLNRIVFGGQVPALAPRVTTPVTLLHGTRDKAALPARAQALAQEHGWQFELTPGHGHQSILFHPRCVADWARKTVLSVPIAPAS